MSKEQVWRVLSCHTTFLLYINVSVTHCVTVREIAPLIILATFDKINTCGATIENCRHFESPFVNLTFLANSSSSCLLSIECHLYFQLDLRLCNTFESKPMRPSSLYFAWAQKSPHGFSFFLKPSPNHTATELCYQSKHCEKH